MKVRVDNLDVEVMTGMTGSELLAAAGRSVEEYKLVVVKKHYDVVNLREFIPPGRSIDPTKIKGLVRFETVSRKAVQG